MRKIIGWLILFIVFGGAFAFTMDVVGFWRAVLIWAVAGVVHGLIYLATDLIKGGRYDKNN